MVYRDAGFKSGAALWVLRRRIAMYWGLSWAPGLWKPQIQSWVLTISGLSPFAMVFTGVQLEKRFEHVRGFVKF